MNDKNLVDAPLVSANAREQITEHLTTVNDDRAWSTMLDDWQSQPYEKVDIAALVRQTRRRTWWAKTVLALDVMATIGLIVGFFIGWYQGNWHTATLAYVGFGAVTSPVYLYFEVKIRLNSWRLAEQNPGNIVQAVIEGYQAALQFGQLIKWTCYGLAVAVNAYVIALNQQNDQDLWPKLLLANALVVAMYAASHYYQHKRRQELTQLQNRLNSN